MSDKYLEIANSALGKKLFSAMGLPEPVALDREDPQQPHKLSGQVLLGSSEGGLFADQIDHEVFMYLNCFVMFLNCCIYCFVLILVHKKNITNMFKADLKF